MTHVCLLLDPTYLGSTMCWIQVETDLTSCQTQNIWVWPLAEFKQTWIRQAVRPNIFGFNHVLNLSECGSDKLLDAKCLVLATCWVQTNMALTRYQTQHTSIQQHVKPKRTWVWPTVKPNILGFSHVLSSSEREPDKLLDPIPLN